MVNVMIKRKRRLFSAVIAWVIGAGLNLLRYAAAQRNQATAEQNDAPLKLKSSIIAALRQALAQGHTCLPASEVAGFLCSRQKDLTEETAVFALERLNQRGDISCRNGVISLPHTARAEETIAHRLRRIGQRLRKINPRRLAEWISLECAELNEEQREAVSLLANSSVAILTGDPGTGKTLTIKSLTAVLERAGYQVYLTAPTGRAAARLAEATGRTAQTLHRLLHNNRRQESLRDLILPQIKEAVIVDEASMLDLFLAHRLVEFCSSRTKLIFVGDVYQLPPVGPGQALRDLIESNQIPIIELTSNHRQSEQSRIAVAARMIKAGIAPELPAPGEAKSDCYFIEADNVTEIQELVVNTAARSLPRRCGADPRREIQVLTPMRKGALGTIALNNLIRLALNREANEGVQPISSNHNFQPSDRVLQTRNNYDLGVFNGECGLVVEAAEKTVTVRFGGRSVTYQPGSTADLTFGFAITIHRSQGSEYPFVIIPVHESQSVMLTRELLYTALTRGKRMVVVIGSRQAFAQAISNPYRRRFTGLPSLLSSAALDPALKMAA